MAVPYDQSAAFSALIYEITGKKGYTGISVSEAVDHLLQESPNNSNYKELQEMVHANGLENVEILDVSWTATSADYGENSLGNAEMNAATFKFPDTNDIYVAYRGTGDGNWKYNADSAFGTTPEASDMQEYALKYFDAAYEKYYDPRGKLYVTGHSQGANNAMYVTLASEHASSIENCVSIDGPGFSDELIAKLKEDMPGGQSAYDRQVDKCYAVYGENDYVHNLGETHIIKEGHYFYVHTPDAKGDFAGYHTIFTHITNGKLNNTPEDNVPEGPVSQLAKDVVAALRRLSNQERYDCAVLAMQIIENANMGSDTLTVDLDLLSLFSLPAEVIEVLVTTLVNNPENIFSVLHELGIDQKIVDFVVNNPLITCAVALAAVIFIEPILKVVTSVVAIVYLIDAVAEIISGIVELGTEIKEFLSDCFTAIREWCEDVKQWWRETFEKGVAYARSNPYFKVDADNLYTYADRVSTVMTRIKNLDRDLNDLYWQVGFLDLLDVLDVLGANLMVGGTGKLKKVKNYLTNTADRFVLAENETTNIFSGG